MRKQYDHITRGACVETSYYLPFLSEFYQVYHNYLINVKSIIYRICCVWLSSPVGCINVLISFITRRSIKMLSWKKANNIKYITDNRKIVIRLVASVWKKKSLNLHKKLNSLANALLRRYNGRQRSLCCATLLFGSHTREYQLELIFSWKTVDVW